MQSLGMERARSRISAKGRLGLPKFAWGFIATETILFSLFFFLVVLKTFGSFDLFPGRAHVALPAGKSEVL